MSTQVQPENQNPENQPELVSPPIQPTEQPTNSPIDENDPLVKLLMESARQANARADAAEQRANRIEERLNNPPSPPPPAKTLDQIRAEFFDNPEEANRRVVREEMDRQMAPIMEFIGQFKKQSEGDKLIDQFKSDVRFASKWNQQLENYVRQQISTLPPGSVNSNMVGMIVLTGLGMQASGMLETPTVPVPNNPTPTNPRSSMPIPPHMNPSPIPPNANPSNRPNVRQLTEDERRLFREYNARRPEGKKLTEEEYIRLTNMSASEVADSKMGS